MFCSLLAQCFGLLGTFQNSSRRRLRSRNSSVSKPACVQTLEPRQLLSATIVVNSLLDGTDPGKTTLRDAITQANTDVGGGDTITFASSLTSGGPATITLTQGELPITQAATITGPGSSLLTIDANHASRIFNINDNNSSTFLPVSISGLTLSNGTSTSYGGAIYQAEKLTISNCTLSGNAAQSGYDGGAIFIFTNGILNSSYNTYSGNGLAGGNYGAAIGSYSTTVVNTDHDTFANNIGGSAYGGAIYNNQGTISITNDSFTGNSSQWGAGLYNNGPLTATNNTASNNTSLYYGGWAFNSGTATFSNNSVINNTAGYTGGGIYNNGTATISNSDISGNHATTNQAGGIYNSGTLTLVNDTVTNNTASNYYGGGIYNINRITISNSTISGNTSVYGGASIIPAP